MASAALLASTFAHLQSNAHEIMELQIALCEIPAPGGGEAARAEAVAQALAACGRGHRDEMQRRPSDGARIQIDVIGHRPAGETSVDVPLVRAAVAALEAEGSTPPLSASSTDANATMAAGVPAIALSWGGTPATSTVCANPYPRRSANGRWRRCCGCCWTWRA